jgi:hypothetical protein
MSAITADGRFSTAASAGDEFGRALALPLIVVEADPGAGPAPFADAVDPAAAARSA